MDQSGISSSRTITRNGNSSKKWRVRKVEGKFLLTVCQGSKISLWIIGRFEKQRAQNRDSTVLRTTKSLKASIDCYRNKKNTWRKWIKKYRISKHPRALLAKITRREKAISDQQKKISRYEKSPLYWINICLWLESIPGANKEKWKLWASFMHTWSVWRKQRSIQAWLILFRVLSINSTG